MVVFYKDNSSVFIAIDFNWLEMRRILPRAAFKEQHQETGCLHTDLFVQRFKLVTDVCNVQPGLIVRFATAILKTKLCLSTYIDIKLFQILQFKKQNAVVRFLVFKHMAHFSGRLVTNRFNFFTCLFFDFFCWFFHWK